MDAPLLKPEFGPTLVELLEPRWRSATPVQRRAAQVLGGLLVAVAAATAVLYPREGWIVHHGRTTTFNLRYPHAMRRLPPRPGEYARLEGGDAASVVLSALHLPPYRGEVTGVEPLYAGTSISALAARTPGFGLQSEGKIRVNTIQGYTFTYASGTGRRRRFNRVVFLTPALTRSRDGVTITIAIAPNPSDPTPDQLAVTDALQEPLHSFRFGS